MMMIHPQTCMDWISIKQINLGDGKIGRRTAKKRYDRLPGRLSKNTPMSGYPFDSQWFVSYFVA